MTKLNVKIIFQMMGFLLIFNGFFMFISGAISWIYKDGATQGIFVAGITTIAIGILFRFVTKGFKKEIKKREGYIVVTMGWIFMSLSGSLPYLFTESIPSFTNAFFETISGYTTTGASILDNIESMPKGILFWRSTTHWIGGMGIIVLTIAVLPLLGIGGMQLFAAEAPGPSADKLHPRITDTAKRLWYIYFGFTITEAILLKLAGMDIFDAVNHAMSTLSTGGFSTKNASLAYWNESMGANTHSTCGHYIDKNNDGFIAATKGFYGQEAWLTHPNMSLGDDGTIYVVYSSVTEDTVWVSDF